MDRSKLFSRDLPELFVSSIRLWGNLSEYQVCYILIADKSRGRDKEDIKLGRATLMLEDDHSLLSKLILSYISV